jgi:hypothetical protein
MEHGKLERSQRAIEQWVQQHPEEVRREEIEDMVREAIITLVTEEER